MMYHLPFTKDRAEFITKYLTEQGMPLTSTEKNGMVWVEVEINCGADVLQLIHAGIYFGLQTAKNFYDDTIL